MLKLWQSLNNIDEFIYEVIFYEKYPINVKLKCNYLLLKLLTSLGEISLCLQKIAKVYLFVL